MLDQLLSLSRLYFDQQLFAGSPGELFLRLVAEALDEAEFNVRSLQNRSYPLTVENTDDLLRLAHLNGVSINPYVQGVVKAELLITYPVSVTTSIPDLTTHAPEILYMDILADTDYFYLDYTDFRQTDTRIITTSTNLIYSRDVVFRHGRVERRSYPVSQTIPFMMLELEEDVVDVKNVFVEYPDGRLVKFYRSRNLHENLVVENEVIYNTRHIYDVVFSSGRVHLLFGRKISLEDPISHTGYTFPAGSTIYVDAVAIDPTTLNSFIPELEAEIKTVKINNRIGATPQIQVLTEGGYTSRLKDIEYLKRELLAALQKDELEIEIAKYFDKYRFVREDDIVYVEGAIYRNGRFTFHEADRFYMQKVVSTYNRNMIVRKIPITPLKIIIRASNILNPGELITFVKDYIRKLPIGGTWITNELVGLIKEKFNVVCVLEIYFGETYARKVSEDIIIYDGVLDVESVEVKPVLV